MDLWTNNTSRLSFTDTGECFANSNGLYIQGTSNNNSKVRLGYNSAVITQGIGCVSIGGGCGTVQGNSSVAIGSSAGSTGQGNNSVAIGDSSGKNQGNQCISIGYRAGEGMTKKTGDNAIAIGTGAGLTSQSTGAIAIGDSSGSIDQSTLSIAIGKQAGQSKQANGNENVFDGGIAIGYSAGRLNQFKQCIAIGNLAGDDTQGFGWLTSGDGCVAIGLEAGRNRQGRRSVAIGASSGGVIIGSAARNQGESSVCIGWAAGYSGVGAYTIAIGSQCCTTTIIANSIVLSAGGAPFNPTTEGFFVNPLNIVAGTGGLTLTYDGTTGQIFKTTSSARYKKDIGLLLKDTSVIHNFKPVEFRYNSQDETQSKHYGFIAEDIYEIDKDLVVYDEEGRPDGFYWDRIHTYNICEVQKLRKELDETKSSLAETKSSLNETINLVTQLRIELDELKGL